MMIDSEIASNNMMIPCFLPNSQRNKNKIIKQKLSKLREKLINFNLNELDFQSQQLTLSVSKP